MTIAWAEPALADLEAIYEALARDSRPYASRVADRLIDAIERTPPVPRIGRVVHEVGDESVRELLFHGFRVIYRVEDRGIVVLAVIHGGRAGERREPRRWELF